MNLDPLLPEERVFLLHLARQAITAAVKHQPLPEVNTYALSPHLREPGASFVTLHTREEQLRGCIGTLEAYQPLAEDVREHAVAAALKDHRFPPVSAKELDQIVIEISRLTAPSPLSYDTPQDLLRRLRPGVDGVILKDVFRRATFLPQVWEQIPTPSDFLNQLCLKMGAPYDLWRRKKLEVLTYQVEEFKETD